MGFQPLDPEVVIDPFAVASFTGPDNRSGLYLDVDQVNSSILIQTNDTNAVYIDKFHNVGINTIAPAAQLDVNSADGACIQLTYNNSSNKANINVASDGKLSLITSGSEVNVDTGSDFNIKSHNGTSTGLKLNNTLVRSTADQLNYVNVTAGTAAASKALVVDSNRDITNLRNFTATNLTGTLQTAAQPNISSVDALDVSTHNGSTVGLKLGGTLITATAAKINYIDTTPGTASASKALVLDSNLDISGINSLSATSLTGTLQTAAQTNITSVGTLDGLTLDGSLLGLTDLSINTTTSGRTVVINSDVGNCLQLCYDTASGSATNYIDFLVSSTGDLSLTPSGGDVDITTHNGSTIGLKLGGTLVTATAAQINYLQGTTLGSAASGKALIFDSSRNIDNINNLTATNLTGTLQTAAQPNINSVNVLNIANHNGSTIGLQLGGTLVSATATELNYVDTTTGTAEASKAIILDGSKDIAGINSLSATSLTGTLQTAAQPNISSVDALDITTHDGATVGLKLGGTLITATAAQINSIFTGGGGGGAFGDLSVSDDLTLSGHDGSTSGLILGSTLVTATGTQLNYTTVTPGTASASKALVLDSSSDISGINSLSANELTGELQTAAQPNITSVGTLSSITTSGDLTLGATTISEAEIDVLDAVTPGTVTASKAVVVDANKDISSFRNLTATNLTGTIQTAAQPNITSTGTLTSITTSGDLTLGATTISESEIGVLDAVTPGTATASKVLILDSNLDISGIDSLSATSLTGTLQTAAQTNITSVGTLTSLGVSSGTSSNTFTSDFSSNDNHTITLANSVIGFSTGIRMTGPNSNGIPKNVLRIDTRYTTTTDSLESTECRFMTINAGNPYYPLRLLGTGGAEIMRTTSGDILSLAANLTTDGSFGDVRINNSAGTSLVRIRANRINSSNSSMEIHGLENGNQRVMCTLTPTSTGGNLTGLSFVSAADTTLSGTLTSVFINSSRSIRQNNLVGGMTVTTNAVSAAQNAFNPFSSALTTFGNFTLATLTSSLGTNFALEGFATPTFTETYTFTATYTRCYFKFWVDGVLQLNNTSIDSADPNTLSFTLPCTNGVRRSIYMQLIPTSGTANSGICTVAWSSASRTSQTVPIGLSTGVNENIRTQAMASPNTFTVYSLTGAATTPLKGELVVDTSGNLAISSSGLTTSIGATNNFDIAGHNGSTLGLRLAGSLVTATATELNYTDVTPGTATASKALVLDSNSDITGIDSLSATSLTGTLQTAAQPNITSTGTLTSITTSGDLTLGATAISESEIGVLNGVTPGTAAASKALILDASSDISGINSLSATELTGELQTAAQPNITSTGTLTSITTSGDLTLGATAISESEIGVLNGVTPGTAAASKALILDASSDISGINSLSATELTGELQTAAQPNITSIGTLTSITTSGDLTLGATAISEAEIGVINGVTAGTVTASKAVVVDANKDISSFRNLTATNLTGTLQTAAQPNITSVGTLTSLVVANDLECGGNLIIGGTIIAETEIVHLDGADPGTASALKAMITDANNSIGSINSLSATTLTGTLQTTSQPNITSIGTLTSITTSGSLTLGATAISEAEIGVLDAVTAGTVTASKAVVVDVNKDISSFRNLTATNLTGTLQTAAQPNITSVGTLTSITTSGDLTVGATVISEADIAKIDAITPGATSASKALVVDASKDIIGINNLSAVELSGTIQTAAQPNISSVDALDITTHDGATVGLKLGGVLLTATAADLNAFSAGTGTSTFADATITSDLTLSGHNGSTNGLILGSTLVTATGTQLNYTTVTPGTASASKALVLDSSSNISGINSLSATSLTGTLQTAAQTNITSVGTLTSITTSGTLTLGATTISETEIAKIDGVTPGTAAASKALILDANLDIATINSLTATSLTGTLQTAAQPNITSVGTLTSITTSGDLTLGATAISEAEISVINGITAGTVTASKAVVVDVNKDISSFRNLTATNLTGTIQTAAQPNIASVDVLDITTHNSSTVGLSLGGSLVIASATQLNYTIATPGTVAASKAVVVDANKDISSFRNLTATNLTGTIQTAAQPNITSVGTLTSITTSGALTLGSTEISESEIGVLNGVTPGTAAASKALVLDSSKDISTIHKLTTEILAVGSPANTNLPVEIGFTSYQYTGAYAYSNDANAHGLIDAGLGPVANYSLRADGRILVTGEIGITSDLRLKENIVELTYDVSKKFIMTTKPVKFNWKNGDGVKDYGYIAQEVLKAGFDDLVTVVPHPGMEGSVDEDGFINPEGAKFTLGSGKIVPLLALNQREIFNELSEKDQKIAELEERLMALEAIIAKLA